MEKKHFLLKHFEIYNRSLLFSELHMKDHRHTRQLLKQHSHAVWLQNQCKGWYSFNKQFPTPAQRQPQSGSHLLHTIHLTVHVSSHISNWPSEEEINVYTAHFHPMISHHLVPFVERIRMGTTQFVILLNSPQHHGISLNFSLSLHMGRWVETEDKD